MIGRAIKWHIEANGWTQYKLAEWMMVNRSVIHRLCSDNSNPTYNTVKRVAKTLGISHISIYERADKLLEEKESA